MLWKLPAAVREVLVSRLCPRASSRAYSTPAAPLRILFCGSDAFSIESLRALDAARRDSPGLIDAIHVAHRPAKPTGRGLKTLREVPISAFARSLALPTHPLDTFTAYTPPFAFNLVIAVSFGLLIPARILSLADHGGLNVHPSLLPDLRGSAPIAHALLSQRTHTGVTVQTLHPRRFDAGVVLAQTPPPGLPIADGESAAHLESRLARAGAEMLVRVLKERRYLAPVRDAGWFTGPTEYARKLTKQDRFVDFATMELRRVLAVQRALGDMWCVLPSGERVVVHEVAAADERVAADVSREGRRAGLQVDGATGELVFRAACGRVGIVKSTTYPGGKAGKGNAKVAKVLRAQAKL